MKTTFRPPWTPELFEKMKVLLADNCTAAATAGALGHGLTRNAVIGMAQRNGVKIGGEKPNQKPNAMSAAPKTTRTSPKPSNVHTLAPGSNTSAAVHAVMALEPHSCRFPIGEVDRPGFHFCGAVRWSDASYCEAHAKAAYTSRRKVQSERLEWAYQNPTHPVAKDILRRQAERVA